MIWEPVNKISVVDEVLKRLTDAIIQKELIPGQKIPPENELCEKLGVGRNSLREATKMLSALGLLEIRRGDGTYIVDKIKYSAFDTVVYSVILEQSTPTEILELRKALDISVLDLVVSKATDEDIELLYDIHKEFLNLIKSNEFEKAAAQDLKFHYALIDIASNPLLGRIVLGVYNVFTSSLVITLKNKQEYMGAYDKHDQIIDVIKNRDKQGISEVIERSLEVWKDYWKDLNKV